MNQTQKIVLTAILFVYTVICGIVIADIGTSTVAGSARPSIIDMLKI
jgi:hypothetical protein